MLRGFNSHLVWLLFVIVVSITLPLNALESSKPGIVLNNSDCTLSATINSDLEVCEEQMIDLDANVTGDYDSFEWTSTEGYSNSSDLDPSVLVTTTTTFTFTATGLSGINAVVNGDFNSGFTGFTSQYAFNPNTNVNGLAQGSFNIDNQIPNLWANQCTPIDGDMMVVNGDTNANVDVYCTTVAVCPNTDYLLSADVMNINNPAPLLQFSANGSLLGSPISGGSPCNIEQFFSTWNSGSSTSLEMCMVNQNTAASGNDFAIDNVSIEEICTVIEQFEVIVHTLDVGNQNSPHLDCNQPTTTLAPIFSGGPVTGYNWSTSDGNILFGTIGPSIEVDQGGEYFVDLSYGHNCMKTTSIIVTDDFVQPDVFISDPRPIDCNNSTSAINIIGEPDYTYFWVLPDGIISFQEDLNTLTDPGDYAVTVTDQSNGCTDAWLIEIEEDLDTIPLNIAVSNDLDCINQVATLTLQPSETPTTILWSNGFDDFNIEVDTAGSYSVLITGKNGCTSTEAVEVEDTSIDIEYSISMIDTLTCTNDSMSLYTTLITQDVTPQWTQGGIAVDSDTIIATTSDYYYLTLTTDDGCEELDSVFIEIDTVIPAYTLNTDTLKCTVPSIPLSIGSDSISLVTWVTPTNETITQPILDASVPGEYQVYVSGTNGCVDTTSVIVEQEANFPEIMISGVDTITCSLGQIDLSANVSFPTIVAEWTLPDNTTTSQADLTITEPGTYLYSVETTEGCITSQEVTIEIDTVLPIVDFTPQTLLDCNNTQVTNTFISSEDVEVNWYQGSQLISTDNTFVNAEDGLYSLEVIAENGCEQEFQFEMTLDTVSPTLAVNYNTIDCINLDSEVIVTTDGDNYTIEQPNQGIFLFDQMLSTTVAGPVKVIAENTNGCTTTTQLMIVIDTLSPSVTLDVSEPLTCVNVEQIPNVDTSDPNLSYDWTGPNAFESNDAEPNLTEAGEYSLLVTSDNGCTDLATLTVDIDTISPTVEISVDLPITCVNEEVIPEVISTGLNIIYDWDGPNNFDSAQEVEALVEAGDYSLVVTNTENGCTDSASIQVQIDTLSPSVDISIGEVLTCVNESVTPMVSASGTPLIFNWDGPDAFDSDQIEPSLNAPGDYSLQVTNSENGCTDTAQVQVLIDTITPGISIDISQPFNCVNIEIFPDVTYTGSNLIYQWSGPNNFQSNLPIPMLTDDGDYSIGVTASNGCTKEEEFAIEIDTVTITPIVISEDLTCDNQFVTLSLDNATDYFAIQWIDNQSGEILTAPSIQVIDAGIYEVIAILENGCTRTQSVEVLDLQDVISVDINSVDTELNCDLPEIFLSTSAGTDIVDFEWTSDVIGFNENNPEIIVTQPGEYSVIVTDATGCTGVQSIIITEDVVEPNPLINSSPFDCISESNQIEVNADFGETISFNSIVSTDGFFEDMENASNSLSISVEGLNGCLFDTIVSYQVFEYLTLSAIDTVLVDASGLTQLNVTHNRDDDEIVSIEWSPSADLSCDDCLDPIYTITQSQEVMVTITDIYGCIEFATIYLLFEEALEVDVFVGNIYLPFNDPSGDRFKAYTDAENIKSVDQVSIYDRWGNLLFTQSDISYLSQEYGWDGSFNGEPVEQGVYVYLFQLTLINDEQVTRVGDVTIVR